MIHHITQGRMNPIHAGHELVVNQVRNTAGENGHTIILTGSQDAKKNPLTPDQKLNFAKKAFPGANVITADKNYPTLLHHLSRLHSQGVTELHMHVGSDRAAEFHALMNKYNGVEGRHGYYKFNKIKIHTVGEERGDDEVGVAGASASKMRSAAASGDQRAFHAMAPSAMSEKDKEEMYHAVRGGMGVREAVSFKQFLTLWK
jgi:hypothetical protein